MPRNRGILLERQFQASIPRGVYVRRLNTPAAPARLALALLGLLRSWARQLGVQVPPWALKFCEASRFTAKQPYDLLILAKASALLILQPGLVRPEPSGSWRDFIAFACEFKSAAGKSLPFADLKPHQEEGLVAAANAGLVAGVVIDYPEHPGNTYFIPIRQWVEWRAGAARKSIAVDDAATIGQLIERDIARGRKLPYWKVGAWLRSWGAEVEG
jgi:hypothetical protein